MDELEAAGRDPQEALWTAYDSAKPLCFTILVDGEPAGLFGATPGSHPELGIPWLLGTDSLLRASRALVEEAPAWISHLHAFFPYLINYVDERNSVSIRWLKRMGFEFPGQSVEVGPTTFLRFQLCATPLASS